MIKHKHSQFHSTCDIITHVLTLWGKKGMGKSLERNFSQQKKKKKRHPPLTQGTEQDGSGHVCGHDGSAHQNAARMWIVSS